MIKDDCIFCKIANGVIPAQALYEDDEFKVIFDRGPASKGHALVLPKEHFDTIFSMDENYTGKVFTVAAKVARAINEEFECDGMNILQNNNEAAGQTVFHFHMHIIPRYKGDKVNLAWEPGQITDEQISSYAEAIRNRLDNK